MSVRDAADVKNGVRVRGTKRGVCEKICVFHMLLDWWRKREAIIDVTPGVCRE